MSNRNRIVNGLINNDAILASSIGLYIIMRPVVHGGMLRL